MTITYVDNVNSMTSYPQHEGEQDVVFQVLWTKSGTDGTYNASYSTGTDVVYVAGSPFTPYDQLTQAQVLGWVYNTVDPAYIENMEAMIAQNIADQANPPTVTLPLPWNVPTPAPEPSADEPTP
jgi:hypothetical protein